LVGDASDIAARPREALNVAQPDGVGDADHDDRDGVGHLAHRFNWLRAFGDDHVGPECDQLGRKLGVPFGAAPGRTNVKGEVAALDPPVFPQRSDAKACQAGLSAGSETGTAPSLAT